MICSYRRRVFTRAADPAFAPLPLSCLVYLVLICVPAIRNATCGVEEHLGGGASPRQEMVCSRSDTRRHRREARARQVDGHAAMREDRGV